MSGSLFSLARVRRAMALFSDLRRLRPMQEGIVAILEEQRAFRDVALGQIAALRADVAVVRRSHDVAFRHLTLPPRELWDDVLPHRHAAEPGGAYLFPSSTLCRQESLEEPVFLYWMARLGQRPSFHRKQWEFAFVCQTLWERGCLRAAAQGLGFGVGEEPLSALFAAEGCSVVGTDQALDAAITAGWTATAEHAAGKEALRRPSICPDNLFEERVSFVPADMNAIPDDLRGFDFCWSACALEHLGDIERGLTFIERSLDTLKPGGWAIHTTELNLTSERETVEHGPTVIFRRSDLEGLKQRLEAQGHWVAPFDWTRGDKPLDKYIDVPPFLAEPHLRLLIDGYEITSIGMIIRKGGPPA